MTGRQKFSTFYLDDLLFGIEVEKIQEVLNYQEITPVPLAPPLVLGLINLRGQIITALDFRQRLGFGKRAAGSCSINIVVRNNEDVVSLLVDKIGDVVEVGEETFEPPPEMLDAKSRALIRGVHKLDGGLMHVLDADQAVTFSP
ncbi:MAG TPA: chemotaxis protein CheW [Candidatus Angelobacter sp.]|nr:chemotaxis protein CheW [Candidatus Angelobacter sp.]